MNRDQAEIVSTGVAATKPRSRIVVFDILNILACFAVIMLHCNGRYWQFSERPGWFLSNLIETVFYFAVPVFFMLSGANLIDYRDRYSTSEFLKRRLLKTLIPFLFWSAVAILWRYIPGHLDLSGDQPVLVRLFNMVMMTEVMNVYWFFIPLFAVYMAIPVLSAIPKESRQRVFGYMIALGFVTFSLLPTVCSLTGIAMNYGLQLPVLGGGYLMFAVMGYYVTHYPLERRWRWAIYAAGVLGWAVHFFGTWLFSRDLGNIDHTFKGYLNFPSVLFALAIFVWFCARNWSALGGLRTSRALRLLSGASFGVYVVHMFVIEGVCALFDLNVNSVAWRLLGPPLVYLISLCGVLLAQRIPYIKKIVP